MVTKISLIVILIFLSLAFSIAKSADSDKPSPSPPTPPPKIITDVDELSRIVNKNIEELNRLLREKSLGSANFKIPVKGDRPLKGGGISVELKTRVTHINLDLPPESTKAKKVLKENIESSMEMIFRDINKSNLTNEEKTALKQKIRKIFQESEYPLRRLSAIKKGQIRWPRGERGGFLRLPSFSPKEAVQLSNGQKIMKVIKVGGAIVGVAFVVYEGGNFIYNVYTFESGIPHKILYATDQLTNIPLTPEIGVSEWLLMSPEKHTQRTLQSLIEKIRFFDECIEKAHKARSRLCSYYQSPFWGWGEERITRASIPELQELRQQYEKRLIRELMH